MLPCQEKHPKEGIVTCKIASARIGTKIGGSLLECEECKGVNEEIIAQHERAGLMIAIATPEARINGKGFDKVAAAKKLMEPKHFRKGKGKDYAEATLRKLILRGVELGADPAVLVDITEQLNL